MLFGLGRYRAAAKLYARALDLGEGKMTRALFGDALMFSGNYLDAISEFDAYIASDMEPESEFVLKAWGLKGLRRLLKCDRQMRQRTAAIELATPTPQVPEVDFGGKLEQALNLDALCGIAWFNLGVCFVHQGKSEDALIAFLWAALVQRKNAEAWANAFGLSVSSSRLRDLAHHIAIAARFSTGEGFMQAVVKNAEAQPANFPKLQYLAAVNEILTQNTEGRSPVRSENARQDWHSPRGYPPSSHQMRRSELWVARANPLLQSDGSTSFHRKSSKIEFH